MYGCCYSKRIRIEDILDPESKLFAPVRGGSHLSDKVVRDALRPALESAGMPRLRIHDLRHFAGAQAARVGDLVETMGRLGHSTVGASLKYQHMVSGRGVEIAEALSELAAKPKLAVVADESSARPDKPGSVPSRMPVD